MRTATPGTSRSFEQKPEHTLKGEHTINTKLNATIRTIEHFNSAYDIYLNYFTDELFELTDDQRDELQGVDDYEDFGYTVINDDTIIMDEGGTVIEVMALDKFFARTMDYLKEAV